ncbi:MAG: hypothetical protein HRT88_10510 [Lentisphaeraceae bacterium]|nr:hypothetical protein [Lentisphaeraceae bacterium]
MSYGLVLSKQAETDIINILEYTLGTFGEYQYHIYRKLIKDSLYFSFRLIRIILLRGLEKSWRVELELIT